MSKNEIFVTWLLEHTGYNGDLFGDHGEWRFNDIRKNVVRPILLDLVALVPNIRLTFQGPPVDAPPMWPNVGDASYYMDTY